MVRRVFLAFLVLGLVACGDDVIGPEDIAGTYTLQSVNGQSLPWALEAGVEVTAGSITLNQDMTGSSSLTAKLTDSGTVTTITTSAVGTYTHVNGAVTMTWATDGSTDSASIVGSQLTLTPDGDVLIFRK